MIKLLLTESFEAPFVIQNIIEDDEQIANLQKCKNEDQRYFKAKKLAIESYRSKKQKYTDEDIDSIAWNICDYCQIQER